MATDDMYKSLKILKIKNIYQLYLFKFMIMMLNGLLPYFYEKLLRPLISNHSYNTRSNTYRQPLLTTEIERRSIKNQLVHLHESLPPELFVNISVKSAVRKYKKLLLMNHWVKILNIICWSKNLVHSFDFNKAHICNILDFKHSLLVKYLFYSFDFNNSYICNIMNFKDYLLVNNLFYSFHFNNGSYFSQYEHAYWL